ncbi:Cytosine/adenosine deaminase [Pandoravirus dulcis]|uniref:Cytosine/adenosine deaminase n=1 Tax=Pandoravirus dulcis TaxID=1349409 RepID=S4VYC3_9VIRU|nr:Cytosine/adenosine deaminase [Pandoravirus dulcis]AGO83051.1 Cytosine/adenosine deaminase [Pandoravirus dulcis]
MRHRGLIVRGAVLLGAPAGRVVDVAIDAGGTITSIEDARAMRSRETLSDVPAIDARGALLVPGLVDAHCELLLRRADDAPPIGSRSVFRATHDDAVARAVTAMAAMVRRGITTGCFLTAADHADAVAEAAVRVGMRAVVASAVCDRTMPNDAATAASDDLDRIAAFARRWRPHPTVHAAVGLCHLVTCRQAYLGGILWGARDHSLYVRACLGGVAGNAPQSIRQQRQPESAGVRLAMTALGARPGALSVVVDGAVPADDYYAIAMAGLGIVYEGSVPPLDAATASQQSLTISLTAPGSFVERKRHIPMPLPTEALAIAAADPFERMRTLLASEPSMSTGRLWTMATSGGGRVLGLDHHGVGTLRVGGVADMVLVDPRRFGRSLVGATAERVIASIVRRAQPADLACVIVGGRVVAAGGRPTLVDECT